MTDEFAEWKAEQAAKWLRHIRELKHTIARIEDEIEVQRSLMLPGGIDYQRPVVSASPSADAIPNAVARLDEMVGEYMTELAGYVDEVGDARRCVSMLSDGRHRNVVTYYYLLGYPWIVVGDKMGYAPDWCRQLRDDALPLVYDVMPREWKQPIPRAD